MPQIEIYHDDMIIFLDLEDTRYFYVEHKVRKSKGYYKHLKSEIVGIEHISVYKIQVSNQWLPEFITITETELDLRINHTQTKL